jgi:hypothetical protein
MHAVAQTLIFQSEHTQWVLRTDDTVSALTGPHGCALPFARLALKPPFPFHGVAAAGGANTCFKLTWLVLGGDPAARSHRVEQFTAL